MLDFIVYWTTDRSIQERNRTLDVAAHATARRLTGDEACSALPNSPIRPGSRREGRRRASLSLRWHASRLRPAPASSGPALADCRDNLYRREATTI